ncbi:hypothetical protein KXD93_14645 [Mucilaginibacter sp. BJC16-A38]|uniref:hypothetical protein n=1 Tax=Mucilaginibacter phenanthrenivorans TaxID=1234842 RepID=UPI002157DB61|nr:hypothetical protein [Mucilaginibacter phenanthrenivorans]MCR8558892.1 hypothetical protein [Mucilaginibacter phenanthrenivorans]
MKTLIKALIAIAIISLNATFVHAQNSKSVTGIYLTEQDYKLNKLTYVLGDNEKLQLNEFLNGKNISLLYQGKKVKLAKSDIYGYKLHNQDYRIFNNEAYGIIDTVGFTIYKKQKLTQQGKGYTPVERYFFSAGNKQPVLALTIENLWNSFPSQPAFRYSIQSTFKQDAELMAYDKLSNQYKLKYIHLHQGQAATSSIASR